MISTGLTPTVAEPNTIIIKKIWDRNVSPRTFWDQSVQYAVRTFVCNLFGLKQNMYSLRKNPCPKNWDP